MFVFNYLPKIYKHFHRGLGLNIGVCVPDTCSPEMVEILVGLLLESLNITETSAVSVLPATCSIHTDETHYRTIDIVAM